MTYIIVVIVQMRRGLLNLLCFFPFLMEKSSTLQTEHSKVAD